MKDYLVIGQGIAGTMLSWQLLQAGRSVLVVDEARPHTASRIAAGIINPVSGRRFEMAWEYDRIYPFARDTYRKLESTLQQELFIEREIWTVFPSAQMQAAFETKTLQPPASDYIMPAYEVRHANFLQQEHSAAIVKGANLQLQNLIPAYRQYLKTKDALLETSFDIDALEIHANHVVYNGITARKIIFCEGPGITQNPYFSFIPFLLNKGEALLIKVPGFDTNDILKKNHYAGAPGPGGLLGGRYFRMGFSRCVAYHSEKGGARGRSRPVVKSALHGTRPAISSKAVYHGPQASGGFAPALPGAGRIQWHGHKGLFTGPAYGLAFCTKP